MILSPQAADRPHLHGGCAAFLVLLAIALLPASVSLTAAVVLALAAAAALAEVRRGGALGLPTVRATAHE